MKFLKVTLQEKKTFRENHLNKFTNTIINKMIKIGLNPKPELMDETKCHLELEKYCFEWFLPAGIFMEEAQLIIESVINENELSPNLTNNLKLIIESMEITKALETGCSILWRKKGSELTDRCPYCKGRHIHGRMNGFRVPHCPGTERDNMYYLKDY